MNTTELRAALRSRRLVLRADVTASSGRAIGFQLPAPCSWCGYRVWFPGKGRRRIYCGPRCSYAANVRTRPARRAEGLTRPQRAALVADELRAQDAADESSAELQRESMVAAGALVDARAIPRRVDTKSGPRLGGRRESSSYAPGTEGSGLSTVPDLFDEDERLCPEDRATLEWLEREHKEAVWEFQKPPRMGRTARNPLRVIGDPERP